MLSMIVPAYNEQDNVALFAKETESAFGDYEGDVEILFIDDGSTDATWRRLFSLVEEWRGKCHIRAISFSRNFGKEAAIYAGLQQAKGDYIGIIDADLQQQPGVLREMLNCLEGDSDLDCVAAYQEERKDSKLVNWLSNKFYGLLSSSSGMPVISDASDFRVFRRNVAEALLSMPENDRFSKGLFAWVGFKTKPYPYVPDERAFGSSKWSLSGLVRYAVNGLMAFSTVPLRVASVLGGALALCSLLYLIFTVLQTLLLGVETPGFATLAVLILLFGGLQLFFLGIVGEYLGRAFIQGKRRPIYLARRVIDTRELDK